jgi:hypothetical protein
VPGDHSGNSRLRVLDVGQEFGLEDLDVIVGMGTQPGQLSA